MATATRPLSLEQVAEIRSRLAEARRYNDFAVPKNRLPKGVTLSTDEVEALLDALNLAVTS